jgi:hypothetical protein
MSQRADSASGGDQAPNAAVITFSDQRDVLGAFERHGDGHWYMTKVSAVR